MQAVDLVTGQPCEMPARTVLCLGNFDGVHRGHQALIAAAARMRQERWSELVERSRMEEYCV